MVSIRVRVKTHWPTFLSPFYLSEASRIDRTCPGSHMSQRLSGPLVICPQPWTLMMEEEISVLVTLSSPTQPHSRVV